MEELAQVLLSKSTEQIKRLLHELSEGGFVHKTGLKRGTRWYSGSELSDGIGAKTPKGR